MSFWTDLFGSSSKRRKKASKKKTPVKAPKRSKEKQFVIFDKYDDKLIARVSGKTETQAWKKWAGGKSSEESDGVRIMTAARWDRESKQ